MATTFTWTIPTLEYFPTLDGLENVVHVVHWILVGNDGIYESSVYGSQNINTDNVNPQNYIPYDQLTPEIVIGWLEASMGTERVNQLQGIVQQQIDQMINPSNIITPPPWDSGNVTIN